MSAEENQGPRLPAESQGDVFIVGQDGLADWCRALEARIEQLTREKAELLAENERLAKRAAEVVTILKALEEAFVIGRLRAGNPPVETPSAASGTAKRALGAAPPAQGNR